MKNLEVAIKTFELKMVEELLDVTQQCQRIWAHELRGPLSPILTVAQILKHPKGLDEESQLWAAQLLENKVSALTTLAMDIQSGRTPKNQEFFRLSELVEAALSTIAKTTGQRLAIECEQGQDSSFQAGPLSRWINPFGYLLLSQAQRAEGGKIIATGSMKAISIGTDSNQVIQTESAPEALATGWWLIQRLLAGLGGELSSDGKTVTIKFEVS